MSGAAKKIGGLAARTSLGVISGGLSELGGKKGLGSRVQGLFGSKGGGGGVGPAPLESPMDTLISTGGAPLLTNIALGADPIDALASYLGTDKGNLNAALAGQNSTLGVLSEQDKYAIQGLQTQLTQIQSNTDMRNQAVQKLVNDFPNYVAQAAPKYAAMWDDNMKGVMDDALAKVGASYAAGGNLSSGAMAAASARAATGVASDRFNYSQGMAMQDFSNQLSETQALQSFQQKMLGQGATQGFNAVQYALSRNAKTNDMTYANDLDKSNLNSNSGDAMIGALGGVAGSFLGPLGAAAGSELAKNVFGGGGGATGPVNTARMNNPLDLFNAGNGYERYRGSTV
jgi:hypothetical protein